MSAALVFSLTLSACFSNSENEALEGSIARISDSAEGDQANETNIYEAGSARYEPYTPERLEELKGNQQFALFFHADWCPLCKKLEEKILEDLENLGPVLILKANHDEDLELRQEYGVTNQTTVLFFDETGEIVEKKIDPRLDFIREFFAQ